MSQSLSNRLIHKLIDWLIAICGSAILLWFLLTQPVFTNPASNIPSFVDTQLLRNHVQLLTNGYAPRTVNYQNLNNAADYIYRQLKEFGSPEFQTISTTSKQYNNVYLRLGPDTKEVYVLGAHYDAKDDSIDSEGNASGVATLIELARNLAKDESELQIGVILIAYPLSMNQSDSLINTGSYVHAASLKKRNKRVRLMVSLDGVGQANQQKVENNSNKLMEYVNPRGNNYINLIGRLKDFNNIRELKKDFGSNSSLSLYSQNLFESFNRSESTDHVNYWNHGYPAVLISDVVNNDKGKKESSLSPVDRLDYERMASLVDGLFQAVMYAEPSNDDKTLLVQRSKNKTASTDQY